MLDFNDHDPAVPSPNGNAERDELRSALLARLEGVLFALFPAGKVTHGKFVVGDGGRGVCGRDGLDVRAACPQRPRDVWMFKHFHWTFSPFLCFFGTFLSLSG